MGKICGAVYKWSRNVVSYVTAVIQTDMAVLWFRERTEWGTTVAKLLINNKIDRLCASY